MKPLTDDQRTLVQENMGLVHYVLKRFKVLRSEYDDYAQIGAIGLCKAARSYDASRSKFATFAVWCIQNEILMELRRKESVCRGGRTYSLDRELPDTEDGATFADLLRAKESVESTYAYIEFQNLCETGLNKKQFRALMLTAQGYNQDEIAGRLGLSQSYVSRILKAARLRIAKWYDGTDETEERRREAS